MKKQALILVGSAMLAFTACNNEQPAESTGPTQAQLDSMNAAQAAEAQEKATQDSLANVAAMEKAKADSLAGALNATKEQLGKKTTTTVTDKKVKGDKTKTKTTTTTTTGGFGGHSDQSTGTSGGGFGAHSDQAQDKKSTQKSSSGGGFGAHSDQNTGK